MSTHADKTQKNKTQSGSSADSQMTSSSKSTFQFVDNRPESVAQRKLQEIANNSLQVKQTAQFMAMADNSESEQPIEYANGIKVRVKLPVENSEQSMKHWDKAKKVLDEQIREDIKLQRVRDNNPN